MKVTVTLCAAVVVCLCMARPTWAQGSAGGSIRGFVKDEQGAVLPGVSVTAFSPAVPSAHSASTDADGYYRLLDLPPASYTVTAELQGFAKYVRDAVVMRAGLTLAINIVLPVGAITETVEVKAETPMLESSSAVQAVTINGDFQRAVPLSARREWHEFLALTPGVISRGQGEEVTEYSVHGSGFNSEVIQIDGADALSAIANQNGYTQLNPDAIEDVQVKTGAVDAASPLGVGAVVNIVTSSGTNRYKGSIATQYKGEGWNDSNTPGGTSGTERIFQTDVSLGGPIQRDHWWWFGAPRIRRIKTGISRSAEQIATLRALVPGFEPFGNENSAEYYFLKTTGRLSPRHQLQVSYQYDRNPLTGDGAQNAQPSATFVTGGPLYAASLSSIWGSSVTTRFLASYNEKDQENRLRRTDVPTRPVHESVFRSRGQLVGTGVIARLDNFGSPGVDFPSSKLTLSADATLYRRGGLGSHELRGGLYLNPRWREAIVRKFPAGGFQIEELVLRDPTNVGGGAIPFHRRIFDAPEETRFKFDTRDYAGYVQDTWKPTGRLTVGAGVRIDAVKRTDRIFDVVVQQSTEVGPRLGVNYMVTADQHDALRASWNRVHDALPTTSAPAGTSFIGRRDLYDLNLDGAFETEFITPGSSDLNTDEIIDDAYHQPFINEWTLGYRRQWPGQIAMDVSLLRRQYRDLPTLVDTNGVYQNGVFSGYLDESQNEIFLLTNNRWNWPVITDLTLSISKRTRDLQVIGSYVRQWRHLAGTWQPNDVSSFIQPNAFPNDKALGDVFEAGRWQDHIFRVGVVYEAPWGVGLATNYTFQSGGWSSPIVTELPEPDPRFGPETVTLSNGREVSNPLATTTRFAFATRGDGQFTLPSLHIWNLRVGRAFRFGGMGLEAAVDILNVTNNAADSFLDFGANDLSGDNFGATFGTQPPRAAQASLRFVF